MRRLQIAQLLRRAAVEMKPRALLGGEAGEHLVEDVIVAFARRRPDHAGLIEKVAMNLRAIEGAVGHLHLDEVALRRIEENRRVN